ncbi:MAG: His/Glu/Gln/Arg/opine family amino acid ABC transporter permease subunit [Candidatus Endobugula sp.]|jgi:His/Glu/Gln/Arg/opine family amino acid ABC transporter permease subunit
MGYEFDWGLPFRQPYLGWLIDGLLLTALLTVSSSAGSIVLGILAAIGRLSKRRWIRAIATLYVELFRNIPTLFWIFFFFFVTPTLLRDQLGISFGAYPGQLAAAISALTLSNSAHIAEIVRSGIHSLPHTQQKAGQSLGLPPWRIWFTILIPQALHISMPALGPRMIHNFHNTSLAMAISVQEVTWQTQQIESITFRGFETVTVVTVIFIVTSLLMTWGFRYLEGHSNRKKSALS